MSAAEAKQFQTDVTGIIQEFGETLSFSRAGKRIASMQGAFASIHGRNINLGGASEIISEQRTVIIPVTAAYTPEVDDSVADTVKNFYRVQDVQIFRWSGVDIAYQLAIT